MQEAHGKVLIRQKWRLCAVWKMGLAVPCLASKDSAISSFRPPSVLPLFPSQVTRGPLRCRAGHLSSSPGTQRIPSRVPAARASLYQQQERGGESVDDGISGPQRIFVLPHERMLAGTEGAVPLPVLFFSLFLLLLLLLFCWSRNKKKVVIGGTHSRMAGRLSWRAGKLFNGHL